MQPGETVRRASDTEIGRGVPVPVAFLRTVREREGLVALRWPIEDGWAERTWGEYADLTARVAGALRDAGVGPGERVLLMMGNRYEFHAIDLAVMLLRATPVSVYNTSSREQVRHVLVHSGATFAVVEPQFLHHFSETIDELRAIIALSDDPPEVDGGAPVHSFDRLVRDARPLDLDVLANAVDPADRCTVVYTSGTTGPPKGVQLTHANIAWLIECLRELTGPLTGKRMLQYGPMAHGAERMLCHYQHMSFGSEVTICPDPTRILEFVGTVRPHMFFGAPRIFEKLRAMVVASPFADDPDAARRFVGLDACEIASMGSAPIPAELIAWFAGIGIPISEAYGLSEATGLVAWDPFELRAGSVGRPVPGIDVRLDDDGEILVRGGNVFPGYLHDPEHTAAVIDDDGWLRTGDIGTFDDDGYLRIVDRKKDIIITAGGKNVSPANIEALLRACPLVDQACVVGDGRRYLVAIVVPDVPAAHDAADDASIDPGDRAALAVHPRVLAALDREVADVNARLSRPEQVKHLLVTADEWTPQSGLLTPTLKIRRPQIAARYAAEIENLYRDGESR